MDKGETCNTGIKEDRQLFLQCDKLRWHISSILKNRDESAKDVFMNSKFCTYMLGMAFEELTDPSSTGESRIVIGGFIVEGL